jgi:uncharacterized protein YvpB
MCVDFAFMSNINYNVDARNNISFESCENDFTVHDTPYEYVFDVEQDLQLPELPTGCEATALGTLLRMNGIYVTKIEVASAMPKSITGEFVHHFWGSPFQENGWACMAPCSVRTANLILDTTKKVAVEHTGMKLEHIPLPAAVWVTMYLEDPIPTKYESQGYKLFGNPHCVVVERIDDEYAYVVDPLVGRVEYPLSKFEEIYNALGSQSVCIEDVKK